MLDKKNDIRVWSWVILVFFILGTLILLVSAYLLGTLEKLAFSLPFYGSIILMALSIVGLFTYRKWGLYLFTIYLVYLLGDNAIRLNYTAVAVIAIVYGYIIWYRGLYKNRSQLK